MHTEADPKNQYKTAVTFENFQEGYVFSRIGLPVFSLTGSWIRQDVIEAQQTDSWPTTITVKNKVIAQVLGSLNPDWPEQPLPSEHQDVLAVAAVANTLRDYVLAVSRGEA